MKIIYWFILNILNVVLVIFRFFLWKTFSQPFLHNRIRPIKVLIVDNQNSRMDIHCRYFSVNEYKLIFMTIVVLVIIVLRYVIKIDWCNKFSCRLWTLSGIEKYYKSVTGARGPVTNKVYIRYHSGKFCFYLFI